MGAPLKLHGNRVSGNAHRVELMLGVLGADYEYVVVDFATRQQESPEFRRLNPLGQIPVLEDGAAVLCDSTAILVYLARKLDRDHRWLPTDPLGLALVQRWLAVAVGEIQAGPRVLRLIRLFGATLDHAAAMRTTRALFDALLEPHLERNHWLAQDRPSVADIACYGYIKRAPEGGFDLERYPNVLRWLARVEGLEGFVPMPPAR